MLQLRVGSQRHAWRRVQSNHFAFANLGAVASVEFLNPFASISKAQAAMLGMSLFISPARKRRIFPPGIRTARDKSVPSRTDRKYHLRAGQLVRGRTQNKPARFLAAFHDYQAATMPTLSFGLLIAFQAYRVRVADPDNFSRPFQLEADHVFGFGINQAIRIDQLHRDVAQIFASWSQT